MGGPHEVVELSVSSSKRRRLALVFVLLVVILIALFAIDPIKAYLAWQANPDDEHASISLWISTARFALFAGGSAIGGAVIGVLTMRNLGRARLRIEAGRITGSIFASSFSSLDLEIGEIFSVVVRRRGDGVISTLTLNHTDGSVDLKGYRSLDAALSTILDWHSNGIDIFEMPRPSADGKIALYGYGLLIVGLITTLMLLDAYVFATGPMVMLTLILSIMIVITLMQIAWGMRRKDRSMITHGVARLTGYVAIAMAIFFAYMVSGHETIDNPQVEGISNVVPNAEPHDSLY